MVKAMREAKDCTSWANPNTAYETAAIEFMRSVLQRRKRNRFVAEFPEFHRRISHIAMLHGLSQTLLKLTSPGVPDTYQGNEVWAFDLVDPDNRRPVDYESRQTLLQQLQERARPGSECLACVRDLLDRIEDGRAKLFVTWKTLGLRNQCRQLFQSGSYLPLEVRGSKSDHLCAFAREKEAQVAIIAAPRLCGTLLGEGRQTPIGPEVWEDTRIGLPEHLRNRSYRNVFTGEGVGAGSQGDEEWLRASLVLANFPVALLTAG
jgi:(1->4)-alpha-D-glucan 1-alpha-D-glucosylmutase